MIFERSESKAASATAAFETLFAPEAPLERLEFVNGPLAAGTPTAFVDFFLFVEGAGAGAGAGPGAGIEAVVVVEDEEG